jgi:hypothetical protein
MNNEMNAGCAFRLIEAGEHSRDHNSVTRAERLSKTIESRVERSGTVSDQSGMWGVLLKMRICRPLPTQVTMEIPPSCVLIVDDDLSPKVMCHSWTRPTT